ncbi:MAG: sigma-70 family RNA polymerase sigma factor [Acidobacteria bacterium]|nr:sigma-70 family RNA polymerase sigma factor [Acidobacteriota bacterium]
MSGRFPSTRRTLVALATEGGPEERGAAMDALARAYWKPLYTYARLGRRLSEEAAEDAVQDLFASLVEKGWLARWDPARARLRTYLRVLLDGLAANTARAAGREKRGGGVRTLSIDAAETEAEIARLAPRTASPEEIYEREWRRWLFTRAVARLEEDYTRSGRGARFALFSAADLADEDPRPTYAQLAERFSLKVTDVTNHLSAARRDFRRAVLALLAQETPRGDALSGEARALFGGGKS